MIISYNEADDAIYFRLDEKAEVQESEEVREGVILDFDSTDRIVGIEVLGFKSKREVLDIPITGEFVAA